MNISYQKLSPITSKMSTRIYIYGWKNNAKRQLLYGKRCRALAWGKRNSVLVEFEDGNREIISRRALNSVNLEE